MSTEVWRESQVEGRCSSGLGMEQERSSVDIDLASNEDDCGRSTVVLTGQCRRFSILSLS